MTLENKNLTKDAAISFLGSSEPTWARAVTGSQLSGLLNLACLVSRTIYISDIDLGDNINFLLSFQGKQPSVLYSHLRAFAEMGYIRVLLRDQSFRLHSQIDIASFYDVYRAWMEQDSGDAWIVKDFTEDRERYFRDLDSWAVGDTVVRYPYKEVKEQFMASVRKAWSSDAASWITSAVRQLPVPIRQAYFEILRREWFSLTDIKTLLQGNGIDQSHPAMLYHGLMNQLTYNDHLRSALIGNDRPRTPIEEEVWPERKKANAPLRKVSLKEISERAYEVLDAPSLSVLAKLTPDEIARLRENGKSYFTLLDLSLDQDYWAKAHPTFGTQFVQAAVNYWGSICDYVEAHYQELVLKPTKLALFLGVFPYQGRQLSDQIVSFAIDAGVDVATAPLPSAVQPIIRPAKSLLKTIKLRFLFLTPTEEFKLIKQVLPNRCWFRRSRPEILKI